MCGGVEGVVEVFFCVVCVCVFRGSGVFGWGGGVDYVVVFDGDGRLFCGDKVCW